MPPWSGKVARPKRSGGPGYFFVKVGLALDAPSDNEAELDGVGDERSYAKVRLLECDYVCWFWGGVGDNGCFGFALAGTKGE